MFADFEIIDLVNFSCDSCMHLIVTLKINSWIAREFRTQRLGLQFWSWVCVVDASPLEPPQVDFLHLWLIFPSEMQFSVSDWQNFCLPPAGDFPPPWGGIVVIPNVVQYWFLSFYQTYWSQLTPPCCRLLINKGGLVANSLRISQICWKTRGG